jgi:hypothetical protein
MKLRVTKLPRATAEVKIGKKRKAVVYLLILTLRNAKLYKYV